MKERMALHSIMKVLESFDLPCYSGFDDFNEDIEGLTLSEIKQTLYDLYEGVYKIGKIIREVKQ